MATTIKTNSNRLWTLAARLGAAAHSGEAALSRAAAAIAAVQAEHAKARTASDMHQKLMRGSDAKLARLGITRAEVPQYIKRLYERR